MREFSLVPIDHEPNFSEISLIPVDHDPFSGDHVTQQTLTQPLDAGTCHTHIRGTDPARDEQYSAGDTQKSDSEGTPAYFGTPSGVTYKYSPVPNQPSQGEISVLGRTNGSGKPPGRPPDFTGSE